MKIGKAKKLTPDGMKVFINAMLKFDPTWGPT